MAETTSDKLQGILNSKEAIREAIEYKGVSCEKTVPLSQYAEKIRAIEQGGSSGLGMNIKGTQLALSTGTYDATNLAIQRQPEDYTGLVDEDAFFVVIAVGANLTFQWQWCAADDNTWSNSSLDGSSTSIQKVPILERRNGQKYRCVITDGDGNTVTSNVATLIVG